MKLFEAIQAKAKEAIRIRKPTLHLNLGKCSTLIWLKKNVKISADFH